MKTTLTLEIVHIDKDDESTWPPEGIYVNVGVYSIRRSEMMKRNVDMLIETDMPESYEMHDIDDFDFWYLLPKIPIPSEEKRSA